MIQLGEWMVGAAFGAAFLTLLLAVAATVRKERALLDSSVRALLVTAFFTSVASAGLLYALIAGDYSLSYVWGHSDRDMPVFYKIGAFWGGMEGSLLFWALILGFYATAVALRHRRDRVELMAPALGTISAVLVFFLGLVLFAANPFERIPNFVPVDGRGLNPLLQHPSMVLHPPSLYLGFVGMTIPFAMAMGALISGRLDDEWIRKSRIWAVLSWIFLAMGNVIGGRWAYVELGWGGYWAWDPVENAALLPWLLGTAYLHSVVVQERKGMLKVWSMVLVILMFLLTIMGTFITRSGLISSVHSFAKSSIGYYFGGFLLLAIGVSGALLIHRLPKLRSHNRVEAFVSRESFFVVNNIVLVVGTLAILWGTLFPSISEALEGEKVAVGPGFFNRIMTPLGLLILFLAGAGPLLPWKGARAAVLFRIFLLPLGAALAALAGLLLIGSHGWALGAQVLGVFVLATVIQEFWRGARARQRSVAEPLPRALLGLLLKNRRRYGGYIVHIGVVLAFIGFSGNAFKQELEVSLLPGQALRLGDYSLTFLDFEEREDALTEMVGANLLLSRGGEDLVVLYPQKRWYKKSEQLTSEVAIHSTLREDFYVVLGGFEEQKISVKAFLNPLVQFFWIGGIVMVAGALVAASPWPRAYRRGAA